jgi:hypothetical protein
VKRSAFIWICVLVFGTMDVLGAPLFRDFMGVNGHTVQFRPALYAPVAKLVRDYHPVEWDLGKESDSAPPFPMARNGVNWESVYGSWNRAGLRVDVCLMFESLPREKWKDLAADARAYGERFARTFGPSAGLGLVESVEIGNEPGKWSDADYRTMFENMARGIRAGDGKLKIATCALAVGKSHEWAKSVECVAGLEELFDVLNVHSYAELEHWPTWRRSFPEDARLKHYLQDVEELCRWRDGHARGKEVWVTEFGYDSTTKKPDAKSEFKDWVGVSDEQQAQWLVRSWLVFAMLPVERANVYFFNDKDEAKLHAASGLTRNFQPKPSYYAAAHLQRTLGEYRFRRVVTNAEPKVRIEEFVHATEAGRRIWAMWLGSGEGARAEIEIPEEVRRIEKIERMPLRADEKTQIPIRGKIEVTESPTYVFFK